ncbi:MAG: primosomal protein N' [Limnoraphis sp. WC205]|jgi:primosomal protein N' (replication factor Y)|nr:primosomal protein N' [Limnoraphis sp. WC205]
MSTITFDSGAGRASVLQSHLKVAEAGASYNTNHSSASPSRDERLIEVLVDIPAGQLKFQDSEGQKLFTYLIPDHLNVEPGDILSVPFGAMYLGAIAIRLTTQIPPGLTLDQIKSVDEVVCRGLFPPHYWQLLQQVATYYQTPLIQVIRTALPPGLLRRSQRRVRLCVDNIPSGVENFLSPAALKVFNILQAHKSKDMSWAELKKKVSGDYWLRKGYQDLFVRGWVESYLESPKKVQAKQQLAVILIGDPHSAIDVTKRQQEILQILKSCGGEAWLTEFLRLCKTTSPTLKTLAEKGYLLLQEREKLRLSQGIKQTADQPKTLTPHQTTALNVIHNLSGFAQVLLHGVTGSGKTEVYLQAIAPILEQGKSALVLVPEIGLTPQLTDRFRARFGEKICVYHSGLSEGERYDTWRNMTRGDAQIIIGTRSAIFAPLSQLGIIILDEEHDSSFKQDQPAPCYHARTVAYWRAEMENCPLILGSATPSLESWVAVRGQQGRGTPKHQKSLELFDTQSPTPHSKSLISNCYYLSLPERIQSRPLPPVEVVDMRQELRQGNRSIFSSTLQQALQQLQDEGKQGILFIHRRGHSTFVSCRSCGYVMECPDCDVSLSYHHIQEDALQTSRQVVPMLRCHYCNHTQLYPQRCPECDSPYFKHFGSGTQRVVEELSRLFPQLRIIRFDSDTTRTKDAHRILLTRFAEREADLLVGTQMLTKGLDLAGVSLVGVISADGLLHLSDYRASERAFQTLLQVAGRAGRGNEPGRVIIQTYTPEHPVIQAVQRYEFEAFVERELQQRQELNYPPFGQLIALKLSSLNEIEVEQTAQQFADILLSSAEEIAEIEILGPAPAPILRIANRYRWQILLKLLPGTEINSISLEQLGEVCPTSVRLMIDVDPLHLG